MNNEIIKKIRELSKQTGPDDCFYVTFERILKERLNSLREALPAELGLIYSTKANPQKEIIDCISAKVDGYDVCSKELLKRVRSYEKMSNLTGPVKSCFLSMVKKDDFFSIDNIAELEEILSLYNHSSIPKILLRLKVKDSSQFGIEVDSLHEFKKYQGRVRLCGIHAYYGSQRDKLSDIEESFYSFKDDAATFEKIFGMAAKYKVFAPGVNVPIFERDGVYSIEDFARIFKNEDMTGYFFEMGRYIVAPSTFFVAKVIRTAPLNHTKDEHVAFLSGGFNHNMTLTSYQRLLKGNPLVEVIQDAGKDKSTLDHYSYKLVGPSCFERDVLAEGIDLPQLNPGDLVVFGNSGAYGPSFSPRDFLFLKEAKKFFIANRE